MMDALPERNRLAVRGTGTLWHEKGIHPCEPR
jgi:hypothetical protein